MLTITISTNDPTSWKRRPPNGPPFPLHPVKFNAISNMHYRSLQIDACSDEYRWLKFPAPCRVDGAQSNKQSYDFGAEQTVIAKVLDNSTRTSPLLLPAKSKLKNVHYRSLQLALLLAYQCHMSDDYLALRSSEQHKHDYTDQVQLPTEVNSRRNEQMISSTTDDNLENSLNQCTSTHIFRVILSISANLVYNMLCICILRYIQAATCILYLTHRLAQNQATDKQTEYHYQRSDTGPNRIKIISIGSSPASISLPPARCYHVFSAIILFLSVKLHHESSLLCTPTSKTSKTVGPRKKPTLEWSIATLPSLAERLEVRAPRGQISTQISDVLYNQHVLSAISGSRSTCTHVSYMKYQTLSVQCTVTVCRSYLRITSCHIRGKINGPGNLRDVICITTRRPINTQDARYYTPDETSSYPAQLNIFLPELCGQPGSRSVAQ